MNERIREQVSEYRRSRANLANALRDREEELARLRRQDAMLEGAILALEALLGEPESEPEPTPEALPIPPEGELVAAEPSTNGKAG